MSSTNSGQNSYESQFNQALCNTAIHPWQEKSDWEDKSMNGTVKLRWIPEQPAPGCSLMTFARAASATPHSISEPATWVGLKKDDFDLLVQETNRWLNKNAAFLSTVGSLLEQIVIVVGPCLERVTCGLCPSEAFMAPHMKDDKMDFLIALSYPQSFRTELEKRDWLQAALTHELEHVWQLLAIRDSLVEPPWLGIIEMCAVYAEHLAHPLLRCYQTWALDFLHSLAMGLVNSGIVPDSPSPYWAFPFISHLESTLPGIYRDLWSDPAMQSALHVSQGPWMALDTRLKAKSSSLQQEWNVFCQSVVAPAPGSLPHILQERMPERHPTFTLDLQDPACAPQGDWPFPGLSAHWVKVLPDPGRDWRLRWEFVKHTESEMFVSISKDGRAWTSLDSTGPVIIQAGSPPQHLLFVHACVPDFSDVYIPKSANNPSILPYAGLLKLSRELVAGVA